METTSVQSERTMLWKEWEKGGWFHMSIIQECDSTKRISVQSERTRLQKGSKKGGWFQNSWWIHVYVYLYFFDESL